MARVGSIPCPAPGCDNADATVSETAAGTLNVSCHRCQFSGYGKAGTKAKRLIEAAMTRDSDAAPPAPATTPAPVAPSPSPAPKRASAFSIGDL